MTLFPDPWNSDEVEGLLAVKDLVTGCEVFVTYPIRFFSRVGSPNTKMNREVACLPRKETFYYDLRMDSGFLILDYSSL
jgi:hypothetical protein